MMLDVTMKKEGKPDQVVKIEVAIVYQDTKLPTLRRLGYEIGKIELMNGGWCTQ